MARVAEDLSSLEEQVEQTEATVGAGAVIQQMSSVLKSLLLLFTILILSLLVIALI